MLFEAYWASLLLAAFLSTSASETFWALGMFYLALPDMVAIGCPFSSSRKKACTVYYQKFHLCILRFKEKPCKCLLLENQV